MNIEGRNAILEVLRARKQARKLYLQKEIKIDEKISEILKLARKRHTYIQEVSHKRLDQLSATGNHQGVILEASLEFEKFSDVIRENREDGRPNWFMCVREAQLEDNVGAIARSAEAAGFDGIIIPPKVTLTPQVVRSSTGAIAHLQIIREGVFSAIKVAKDNGIPVVGIEVATERDLYATPLLGEVMFVVGGEDRSLSAPVREKCDLVVKIPMRGKINSLNMSVAAAVVMFEKLRQEAQSID